MPELTILGTASGAPTPSTGCAAYLVQHEGTSLLLDCGPGTLGRLRGAIGLQSLAAVVISHLHSDHYLDLIAMNVALAGEQPPAGEPRRRLPVLLPPRGKETVDAVFRACSLNVTGTTASRYAELLDCREYADGETLTLGSLTLSFAGPMHHATVDYGVRVEGGGRVLAYPGDTAPCPQEQELARNADLFLSECTFPQPGTHPAALHTSAPELGDLAAAAGCKRVVATHFGFAAWPADETEREAMITAGIRSGGYQGELLIAAPGRTFSY